MSDHIKWTVPRIRALKGKGKIVSLTAYDFSTARLVDEAGIHLVLVGDSLAMTMLGYENTLPVTMDEMLLLTAAVARGVKNGLVVADMPFLSCQVSIEQALMNAGRFIKEAGADAVKIEGGSSRAPTVRALVENGIPVLGHIGLLPQNINAMGGFKIQGKSEDDARRILDDAKAIEEAGAFAVVLEGLPAALAGEISRAIAVPTIGIGAGPGCDGQILVVHDILSLYGEFKPKFVKRYANLGPEIRKALAQYKKEVEDGSFPGPEQSY